MGAILTKGKAGVLKLPAEKLREIGLVPETWSLEVVADTASSSVVERPLTRAQGNALDWNGLMKLAEKHAVRFLHPCFLRQRGRSVPHQRVGGGTPPRNYLAGEAESQYPAGLLPELPPGGRGAISSFFAAGSSSGDPAGGRYPLFSLTR